MMLISWMIVSAFAADGYYDTASVAASSEVFTEANTLQSQYADASARSSAIARALDDYQVALSLLGDDAPPDQQAHLDALTAQYAQEHAVLQRFVSGLVDDFDQTFTASMDRAIAAMDGTIVECEGQVAVGRQLPGMPVRTEANPDCTGEDLNASIAAAMDADPALRPAVTSLMATPWPVLTVPEAPQAATVGDRAVPVARELAADTLRRVARAEEEARLPIEAAVEDGTDPAEEERLRAEVARIEAQIAAHYRELFAPVQEQADKRFAKLGKRSGETVGWCANPAFFGGCTTPALEEATWQSVAEHPKVVRAARR